MRAIILAAGRGNRLRPITDLFPKPLLRLDGVSLLERQIMALNKVGIDEICINLHWLGEQIHAAFAQLPGIHWQWEPVLLDTGGSLALALPWLCENEPEFLLLNADIYHDFALERLVQKPASRLVLIPTAGHEDQPGDFGLLQHRVTPVGTDYIYGGMAKLHQDLFAGQVQGNAASPAPLFALLQPSIMAGKLGAVVHKGEWNDLGTLQRLAAFDDRLTDPQGLQLKTES